MQLLQTENDLDYKEFKLCNDDGDIIVSFDVLKKEYIIDKRRMENGIFFDEDFYNKFETLKQNS